MTAATRPRFRDHRPPERERPEPLTGCPCGCSCPDECVTRLPVPRCQTCRCSTLGIEDLRRPSVLRWHLAGHPVDEVGRVA
jgi:hypothetical protein